MFHTNYSKITETVMCDDDCEPSGCPKHTLTLEINNCSGVAVLKKDEKEMVWFDCGDADALYKMFQTIKNE